MPLSAYLRDGLAHVSPDPRPMMATFESKAPESIRFFDELGEAMRQRLSASADSDDSLIASFHQIGLNVGKGFEWQTLSNPAKCGLECPIKVGEQIIPITLEDNGRSVC